MRPANKPALADAIWALMPKDRCWANWTKPVCIIMYSMAGPWCTEYRGNEVQPTTTSVDCTQTTHKKIMDMPFDGYQEELSTTDGAHFTRDMFMNAKKEDLLSNKDNKQRFIRMLGQNLEHVGCETRHAKGCADVLIVETTV